MTTIQQLNGTTKNHTSDWMLVRDGGLWLVGKVALDLDGGESFPRRLVPVFELTCQVQPQQGGGILIAYGAQPMLLIASLEKWVLSPTANVWPVRGMSCEAQLREAIKRAEGMVQSMRAQQSGLVIAREIPKAGMQ